MKRFRTILYAAALSFLTGCNEQESTALIPAVQPFSVRKYLGVWHEAARMPHRFEKGMERVTAEYTLLEDGTIRVRNAGFRDGKERVVTGIARQKQKGTGELEVSFFRPFYGDYRVIALKEDYSAALVTSSSKDYAWILVRDPNGADAAIRDYVFLLMDWGFDCSKLEFPNITLKNGDLHHHNEDPR